MFGYVRLCKPEIKMGEYEQYRGIYCTLCRRLGRRYGLHARMTLSFDLTFLALLQTALSPQFSGFRPGRCSFNAAKRCPRCTDTAAIDRAADIGVLLTYHKLRDTAADERGPKRLAAVLALPPALLEGWRLYLSGALTATAAEYLFHWWGEAALRVRFWDYTGLPGSLRGRVCLPFSLAWGLLVLPAVHLAAPAIAALSRRVPPILTWVLLLGFTADTVCSLRFLAVTHDLWALRQAF